MRSRLVPKSMNLNNNERSNGPYLRYFTELSVVTSSSFYLFTKQFHENMTAGNTRTGPTRLAKHSQWPQ